MHRPRIIIGKLMMKPNHRRKYHSGTMWRGVERGSAMMLLSQFPKSQISGRWWREEERRTTENRRHSRSFMNARKMRRMEED